MDSRMHYGSTTVTQVTLKELQGHVLGFSLKPNQRLNRFSYPIYFENCCKDYLRYVTPPPYCWYGDWTRFSTLNFEGLIVYNYHKGPEGYEFEGCTDFATLEDVKNWKTAIKCLQRYCLNLLLDPYRQDFHQIYFSTGYYQYNIAKNFKGAEKILEAMGYIVPFSDKANETIEKMCLKEPKNLPDPKHRAKLAWVLVDLILFDFELDILVKCINEYRKLKPGHECTIMEAWEARKNTSGGVESALGYLQKFDQPHMSVNNVTEHKLLGISGILPLDHGEFGLTQHINPSSYDDDDDDNQLIKDSTLLGYRNPPEAKSQVKPRADPAGYSPIIAGYRSPDRLPPSNPVLNPSPYNDNDDNQLIKDSTLLGYRNPPEAKSQVKPTIQPRVDAAGYSPITAGYRPPDRLPPSNPVLNPSSYNDNDDNQLIKDSTLLGYRNPPEAKSQVKPTIQPRVDPAGYSPITAGYRPPDWLPPVNPGLIPTVSTTYQSIPYTSPDSKYGKTNLSVLKKRLQHKKEVTDTMVQTGGAGPNYQSTSNIPFQGGSDSTAAGKANLTSLRNRLEKTKEIRQKVVASAEKDDDFHLEMTKYLGLMANPQMVTSANLTSDNTHSTSSSKKSYKLWQCAQCQTVNEAHRISCNYCEVAIGSMADTSIFCDFCQLMFIAQKGRHTDTCARCPRCKQVCETAL